MPTTRSKKRSSKKENSAKRERQKINPDSSSVNPEIYPIDQEIVQDLLASEDTSGETDLSVTMPRDSRNSGQREGRVSDNRTVQGTPDRQGPVIGHRQQFTTPTTDGTDNVHYIQNVSQGDEIGQNNGQNHNTGSRRVQMQQVQIPALTSS